MSFISKSRFFNRYLPMSLTVLLIVGAVLSYQFLIQKAPVAQASWYSTGGTWAYRKTITVNHTKVSSVATSTYSNFPMLFNVTDTDLKFTGSGGLVASSTGADILFTDSDGTTLLNYEIEKYASTTGETVAWVRIPTLTAATDYVIYMYFGNASAPAETAGNITGTWDTNYKGVWHLPNTPNLTALDSTTSGNNGTIATPVAQAGQIDGAAKFNGSSDMITTGTTSLTMTTSYSVSAWVFMTSLPNSSGTSGRIFIKTPLSGAPFSEYGVSYVNTVAGGAPYADFRHEQNSGDVIKFYDGNTGAILVSTWYFVTATWDGSTMRLYFNNSLSNDSTSAGLGPITTAITAHPSQNCAYMGADKGDCTAAVAHAIPAYIDDVRVSNIARSADWVATEYANQSSPPTFYSVSGLQNKNKGVLIQGGKFRQVGGKIIIK